MQNQTDQIIMKLEVESNNPKVFEVGRKIGEKTITSIYDRSIKYENGFYTAYNIYHGEHAIARVENLPVIIFYE